MVKQQKAGWNLHHTYEDLPETFYSKVNPTPGRNPELVIFNDRLATELGLSPEYFKSSEGIDILGGSYLPPQAKPLAQAYAGHQFGNFTQLGDGRAILLGEQTTPKNKQYDIQLKGAGRTPYSRGGDGRAGLSPMLREYMMSEAMHSLGISTTRGLAVTKTGEGVMRETIEEGAIVTRVASSHIRVGTFQYAVAYGTSEDLKMLADYTIKRHDPELLETENRYLGLLKNVVKRQAKLLADWQRVGFIHGVMNTDNMTISGETIDYGPCAFMDNYDPKTVFSSIDQEARYAYGNQPYISGWNLTRFAESLLGLIHEDEGQAIELAQSVLSNYNALYEAYWLSGMRAKLGMFSEEAEDKQIIDDLLQLMEEHHVDYTNTFLDLTFKTFTSSEMYQTEEFKSWKERWDKRLETQQESDEQVGELMRENNPAVIPRNYYVEEALEAAVENNDDQLMKQLLKVLENPYAHSQEQQAYRDVPEFKQPYQTFCGT